MWPKSLQEEPLGRLWPTSGTSSGVLGAASGRPKALLGFFWRLLGVSWAQDAPRQPQEGLFKPKRIEVEKP